MTQQLFRKQAVDFQNNRLHGDVLLVPKVSHKWLTIVLMCWVAAVVFWLVNNEYARKATVAGWLQPPEGVVKVFAENTGGKVKTILVSEGEKVVANQALVVINGDRFLADGGSLEETLLVDLYNQQTLIKQQIERAGSISQTRLSQLTNQKTSATDDLKRIAAQIHTLKKRQSLMAARLENYREMQADGHIPAYDAERLEEQLLAIHSEHQAFLRERSQQIERVEQIALQISLLPEERDHEIDNLNARLSDVNQKVLRLQGQRAHVIRATRAGTVSNLQIAQGQTTVANKPLLSIVPEKATIEARILVPVRAAGFVSEGQQVDIRYDAFPYQKFGLYQGEIVNLSESIILPGELEGAPVAINEPVYLATARLSQQHVTAFGHPVKLKTGMTFAADISLAHRTLLEWLLEPLYSLRGTM